MTFPYQMISFTCDLWAMTCQMPRLGLDGNLGRRATQFLLGLLVGCFSFGWGPWPWCLDFGRFLDARMTWWYRIKTTSCLHWEHVRWLKECSLVASEGPRDLHACVEFSHIVLHSWHTNWPDDFGMQILGNLLCMQRMEILYALATLALFGAWTK